MRRRMDQAAVVIIRPAIADDIGFFQTLTPEPFFTGSPEIGHDRFGQLLVPFRVFEISCCCKRSKYSTGIVVTIKGSGIAGGPAYKAICRAIGLTFWTGTQI
ncbi:hypothetical protein D3C87_1651230 [compost metagenome]